MTTICQQQNSLNQFNRRTFFASRPHFAYFLTVVCSGRASAEQSLPFVLSCSNTWSAGCVIGVVKFTQRVTFHCGGSHPARVKFFCRITGCLPGCSRLCQCLVLTDRSAEKTLNHTATSSLLDQQCLARFISPTWGWAVFWGDAATMHLSDPCSMRQTCVSWIPTHRDVSCVSLLTNWERN